jgi:iron(III) transport system permease protein
MASRNWRQPLTDVTITTAAATTAQAPPHAKRRRLVLLLFVLVEALILLLIGTQLVQVQIVEDYREVVGNLETIYFRREIVGDPPLLALLAAALFLPLLSAALRREWFLLALVQLTLAGLVIFVLWPLAQVFIQSFKEDFNTPGFTLFQFQKLIKTPAVARAVTNTFILGVTTATLSTALGALVAYALTLVEMPARGILRFLAVLPLVSPPFAVSFAFILLFGRRGVITYDWLGITDYNIYGPHGIILVQLISDIPLAILILSAVFAAINRDLDDAAQDLGARPFYILRTITFPLITPALLTTVLLTFISSISDFGNPMLIGGGFQTLATQAYIQMLEFNDLQLGAALALLLVIPALLAFLLQHHIAGRRSYVTVTSGARASQPHRLPGWLKWPLFALCLLLAIFSILIYGSIFIGAFVNTWGFDYTPTLRHTGEVWSSLPMLRNSLVVSFGAGILGGVLGILMAWLVTRKQTPGRRAIDFTATLMYAIPGTVIGIGYVTAFNGAPYFWTGTFMIIIIAFAYRRLPVGLRTGVAAQSQIDNSLEEASLDLGASRLQTFRRITFPLLSRAFTAGVIYIFIHSMTDLSSAVFLNAGRTQLFTVRMFRVMTTGTPSQAAAYAVLLIVIIVLAIALLSRLTRRSFIDSFRI